LGRGASAKGSSTPSLERILLAFDLNVQLPSTATVTQGILHLYNVTTFGYPPDPTPNAAIHRNQPPPTPPFTETGATWANRPASAASPAAVTWSLAITTAGTWVTRDVTSLTTDCRLNGGGQCSWQLQWVNEVDNTTAGAYFASKESIYKPYLEIRYTLP
jgi:hypothetical protein